MRPPFYAWNDPHADRDALAVEVFRVTDDASNYATGTSIASYAARFSLTLDEAVLELAEGLVRRGEVWVFMD